MAKRWTPRTLFRLGRAVVDRMEPIDPFPADERPDRTPDAAWRPIVKRRALCALAFLAVWAVTLEARLVMLQVVQHDSRLAEAIAQQESEIRPEAPRGDILDRDGRLMAYSVDADSIVADPSLIEPSERRKTADAICDALRDCTRKDREELVRTLSSRKRFVYVRRSRTVLPDQVARVDALGLPGILLRTEPRRYYPYAELAAHVLGFVGLDNTGQAGVEYSFDQDVQGQAGLARVQVDAHGRRLDTVVERPPVPGATVELTIDVNLQYIPSASSRRASRRITRAEAPRSSWIRGPARSSRSPTTRRSTRTSRAVSAWTRCAIARSPTSTSRDRPSRS
jgi:cell division protein FtsI/penicillin-binding protein 2